MTDVHRSASEPVKHPSKQLVEALKVDFAIVRAILLTAAILFSLVALLVFYGVTHYTRWQSWDDRFKIGAKFRPSVLATVPELLNTGYSKHFVLRPKPSEDELTFYAAQGDRVTLALYPLLSEDDSVPRIKVQLNGHCTLPKDGEFTVTTDYDLTADLSRCGPPEGTRISTLRVIRPGGIRDGQTVEVDCLILVSQRIHEPFSTLNQKDAAP